MDTFTIKVGALALDDLSTPLYERDMPHESVLRAGVRFTSTEMVVPDDELSLNTTLFYVGARLSLIACCDEYEVPDFVDGLVHVNDEMAYFGDVAGNEAVALSEFVEVYRALVAHGATPAEGFDVDVDWSDTE